MFLCSCWLSKEAFYFAFLLPLGVILFINFILFIIIIKHIASAKRINSTQLKERFTRVQVKTGVCCFVVMGDSIKFFEILQEILKYLIYFYVYLNRPHMELCFIRSWRSSCGHAISVRNFPFPPRISHICSLQPSIWTNQKCLDKFP